MSKGIVLLSGGLDSATVLSLAKKENKEIYTLSFRYGQRHTHELSCAAQISKWAKVKEHRIVDIDLRQFGKSALTSDIPVPKNRDVPNEVSIPVTYVPARNTIFLSFALAWAETLMIKDIYLGVNALDYSGYPDCRPEYIQAFQMMANLATKSSIEEKNQLKIRTPLINLTKEQIIKIGIREGVDYSMTSSCYDPQKNGRPCGECDACLLRERGFRSAKIDDPLLKRFTIK